MISFRKISFFFISFSSIIWPSHQLPSTSFNKNSHIAQDEGNFSINQFSLNPMAVDRKSPMRQKRTLSFGLGEIGTVDSVESLVDYIYAKIEEVNGQEVYSLLNYIDKELLEDRQNLYEMTNLISNTEQKNQYLDATKVISMSLKDLKYFAETKSQSDRNKFLETAYDLKSSVFLFYQDLLSKPNPKQETREDILKICESHFQGHRKEFVRCVNSYIKLLESGYAVLAGYYQLEKLYSEREWNVTKTKLIRNHKQIETRVFLLAEKCARPSDKVRNEMAKIMSVHQGLDNEKMADKLFDYLSDKYDTDYWLVIVYNGIEGGHNHWQSGFYHYVFRQGGKNALAISRNKLISKKTYEMRNNSLSISNALTGAVKVSCKNDQCDGHDAHQLVDHLSRNYVLEESTLFAIDNSADVVKRVDPNFVPYYFDKLKTKTKTYVVVAMKNEYPKTKLEINEFKAPKNPSDPSGSDLLRPTLALFVTVGCILKNYAQ